MLVPHGNQRVRSVEVSERSARVAGAAGALFMVLFVGFAIGFFIKQGQHLRTEGLGRENAILASELEEMRARVATLSGGMELLATKNEEYRVMAGLPAIERDVQRVGIGGPGTRTLEASELFALNEDAGERLFTTSYDLSTLVRRAGLLNSSMDEALETLRRNAQRLAATPSIVPATGYLSSLFSKRRRHPVLKIIRPHEGIDISAPVGEPILAPAAGRILFAGRRGGGYGNTVEIDHGYGIRTLFAHASRVLVRRGERVERGEVIAEVGATGLVSGPHLHYEVEVGGKPVDPLNFIIWDAVPE